MHLVEVFCTRCKQVFQKEYRIYNQVLKKGYNIYCKECWKLYRPNSETIKKIRVPKPLVFCDIGNGCIGVKSHKARRQGYPVIANKLVSHIVYEGKFGSLQENEILRHTCDNPECVNLSHLIKGTHAENVADRVERNRSAKGEKNGRAKLNIEKAREIRTSSEGNRELARIYKIDPAVIRKIKRGLLWKE